MSHDQERGLIASSFVAILQKRLNMCVLGQNKRLFFLGMFDEHFFFTAVKPLGLPHACLLENLLPLMFLFTH